MKKILVFVLLLTISKWIFAENAGFIYVDAVHIDCKTELIKKIKKIINNNQYKNFIIFISNGRYPYVLNQEDSIEKKLNIIYQIDRGSIDLNYEIDTINGLLFEFPYFGQNMKDTISFNFIMEEVSYSQYEYKQRFVERFLLANRMIKDGKIEKNIILNEYFLNCKEDKYNK